MVWVVGQGPTKDLVQRCWRNVFCQARPTVLGENMVSHLFRISLDSVFYLKITSFLLTSTYSQVETIQMDCEFAIWQEHI